MSGEFGAARLGFSKYALILAISNEKTGFQGPKFSVLRPPPPLHTSKIQWGRISTGPAVDLEKGWESKAP